MTDLSPVQWLLLALLWVAFGVITSNVARQKGRDPFLWFFIGCLFGWIGLILVFVLPRVEEDLEGEVPMDPISDDEVRDTIEISATAESENESPHARHLWYYLNAEHEQEGPVSFDYLRELWQDKRLLKESFVWREGMDEWQKVQDIDDLASAL